MKTKADAQNTGLNFQTYTDAYKNGFFPLPAVLGNLDPSLTLSVKYNEDANIEACIKPHDWLGICGYPECPVVWGQVGTEDADGEPIVLDMAFVHLDALKAIINEVAKGHHLNPETSVRAFFVQCQTVSDMRDLLQKAVAHGVPKQVRVDMCITRDTLVTQAMQSLNDMLNGYRTAIKRP